MIKKSIKRFLATSLSLVLASGMAFSGAMAEGILVTEVKAANNTSGAEVEYYKDKNNNRTGFKSIKYDGIRYYNIIEPDASGNYNVADLDMFAIKNILGSEEIQKKWAKIGVGMMLDLNDRYTCNGGADKDNTEAKDKDFYKYFVNGSYSDDEFETDNLADVLGSPEANHGLHENKVQGEKKEDYASSTGLIEINSLKDARDEMAARSAAANNDWISKSELLSMGEEHKDDSVLPDMKVDDSTKGYANIVTTLNRQGKTFGYDYASFGMVFYDIDLAPINEMDGLDYIAPWESCKDDAERDQKIRSGSFGQDVIYSSSEDSGNDMVTQNVTNPTEETVPVSINQGTSVSSSFSNSLSTYSNWGVNTSVGFSTEGKIRSVKASFGIKGSFSTSWNHSEDHSEEKEKSESTADSVSVELPPHTGMVTTSKEGNTSLQFNYKCPVAITYKVAFFGMSGHYYSDHAACNYIGTATYSHGYFNLFVGNKDKRFGSTAEENLKYRLTKLGSDVENDRTAAKTSCYTDESGIRSKDYIDWSYVKGLKDLGNVDVSELNKTEQQVPMAGFGAKTKMANFSRTYTCEDLQPLYPLGSVKLSKDEMENESLSKGNKMALSTIGIEGYDSPPANKNEMPYYGFDKDDGHWVLCDEDGAILEEGSDVAKINVSPNGYQYLEGLEEGTVHLKWVLNDDVKLKCFGSDQEITAANFDEKVQQRTNITVNVMNTYAYEVESFNIEHVAPSDVNTSGYLNGLYRVMTKDTNGYLRKAPYYWKAKYSKSDSPYKISDDGKVTIDREKFERDINNPDSTINYGAIAISTVDKNFSAPIELKPARVEIADKCKFVDDNGQEIIDKDGSKLDSNIYIAGDGVRIKSDVQGFLAYELEYPDGNIEMIFDQDAFFIMPELEKDQTLKVNLISDDSMFKEWKLEVPSTETDNLWIGNGRDSLTIENLADWLDQGKFTDEEWAEFSKDITFTVTNPDGTTTNDTTVDGAVIDGKKLTVTKSGTYKLTAKNRGSQSSCTIYVREVAKDDTIPNPDVVKPILGESVIKDVALNEDGEVAVTFEGPDDKDGSYLQVSTNKDFIAEEDESGQIAEEVQPFKIEGNKNTFAINKTDENNKTWYEKETWYARVYAYGKKDPETGDDNVGVPSETYTVNLNELKVKSDIETAKEAIGNLSELIDDSSEEAIQSTEQEITAAREAYEKVPEDKRSEIDSVLTDKLTHAEKALETVKAINALPETASINDKETVEAARKAYDEYTSLENPAVTIDDALLNTLKGKLDTAEEQYAQAVADHAKSLIENLPTTAELKDKNAVEAAKAAYEAYQALPDSLKEKVKDFDAKDLKQKVDNAVSQVKAAEEANNSKAQTTTQTNTPATAPAVKVSSISLNGISNRIAAGKKIKLTATVLPANAANKKLKWTTSNKKVATVTQSGLVKVKKKAAGKTVKIIATASDGSGKKAVWKIKAMKGVVKKIKLTGAKKTLKAGKTMKLKARVKASKGANKKLKWISSNPQWATVSAKGKVKAKVAGAGKTVKITVMATDGSGKKIVKKVKITK